MKFPPMLRRMFPLQLWGINKKSFPQVPGFLACLQSIEIFLLDSVFFSPFPIHTRPFAFQWAIQLVSLSLQYIICIIYKMNKVSLIWPA